MAWRGDCGVCPLEPPVKNALTALLMSCGLLLAASAHATSPVMPSALSATSVSASTKVKPAKRAKRAHKAHKAKTQAPQ